MKKVTIEAQIPAKKEGDKVVSTGLGPASVEVQFAENLKEAEAMFGAEAVLSNALANWTVTIQSGIRAGLRKGENQAQIQTRLGSAKMGVAQPGAKVDVVQGYLARFQMATPDEQQKMIAEIQARKKK